MADAGGTYKFPIPNPSDPLDVVTDVAELAVAVDAALYSAFTPLSSLQTVRTVAVSGWSEAGFSEYTTGVAPVDGRRQGDIVSIDLQVKYNKTIALPANGDIANIAIGTITEVADRPKYDLAFFLTSPVSKYQAYGIVLTSGSIVMTQIHSYATSTSTVTVATGSLWRGTIRYSTL